MFDLVFNIGVGLSLYMVLLATAREHLRERMRRWFSLDRERLAKALAAACPVLLTIVVFQTLIIGGQIRLTWPSIGNIAFVAICFLIPFIEEWVRGVTIVFCDECGSVPLVGLLISSTLFALLHSLKVDFIFAQALTFGLLAGLLTIWSKGIAPSILVHVAANVLIVSMAPA